MKKIKFVLNNYLTTYSYLHRKIALGNMPRIRGIEITNFCNLSCSICPRRFMTREVGFMDFALFKRIIDQCKYYTDFIWLHYFGEPLFHPQLSEFINYCWKNNVRSGISTNATILDKDKAAMLLASKLDVLLLCLDGINKETHERIRCNADFDKTRNNILGFLELKKSLGKNKPMTNLSIIKIEENKDEIDAFKKQWQDSADYVYIKPFTDWASQEEKIAEKMVKAQRLDLLNKTIKRYPCCSFWQDGFILWNGDFVPCCRDFNAKMALGNTAREKLKDIWNSAKIKEVRQQHYAGNYDNPLCKNCSEWTGSEKNIFYPFSLISKKSISALLKLSYGADRWQ